RLRQASPVGQHSRELLGIKLRPTARKARRGVTSPCGRAGRRIGSPFHKFGPTRFRASPFVRRRRIRRRASYEIAQDRRWTRQPVFRGGKTSGEDGPPTILRYFIRRSATNTPAP